MGGAWGSVVGIRVVPHLLPLARDWISRHSVGHKPPLEMAGINHWSITLAGGRARRPRWLTVNGRFSSNPALALRLVTPEVAARRVQTYMKLRGWPTEAMERFVLVPSPPVDAVDKAVA